jgi:branched-chain amino acid transport system substrate-binding protein
MMQVTGRLFFGSKNTTLEIYPGRRRIMSEPIRIGILATLFGPFAVMGQDGVRGVELAVEDCAGEIAGRRIELHVEGTMGTPDMAEQKARNLLDQKHVDFIVGPLSGNEGLAIRNFAKTREDRVFLNGSAGAQELTLLDGAANFFNFAISGVQVVAGLGTYVYQTLGYKRIVILGEDYSYPHAQIGGFMLEYCRLGGVIVDKLWVPLGNSDYSTIIPSIPDDIDAVFVALGGTDAIHFLQQYQASGRKKPLFGGGITTDQSVLSAGGPADMLVGMVAGGPTADDNPDPHWQSFLSHYRRCYPDGLNYPSYFALQYYLNARAGLLALNAVGGDLSKEHARFKEALRTLTFAGPSGTVSMDCHQGAVGSSFVTIVKKDDNGILYRSLLKEVKNVNQTLGLPEEEYLALGTFSRTNPEHRDSNSLPQGGESISPPTTPEAAIPTAPALESPR